MRLLAHTESAAYQKPSPRKGRLLAAVLSKYNRCVWFPHSITAPVARRWNRRGLANPDQGGRDRGPGPLPALFKQFSRHTQVLWYFLDARKYRISFVPHFPALCSFAKNLFLFSFAFAKSRRLPSGAHDDIIGSGKEARLRVFYTNIHSEEALYHETDHRYRAG